ncbi:hypothetical protein B0H12DRAFT_150517 [Mycena haematopus]|nr:hypothetical protein B0H12DRAFT_150517 [Mycena haematopus]
MALTGLPDEVICEIIEIVPLSDLAILCGTSKLLHALGVPILYRTVELSERASIETFCSTVLANPGKFAELVRTFTVTAGYRVSAMLDIDNTPFLADCCNALQRIENLSLDNFLHHTQRQMQSGTFPHLVRCTLSAVEDGRWASTEHRDWVAAFLLRHPVLESIWITDHPNFESWPSTSAPIPMLNLQHLRAPPKFLSSITGTQLKDVRIQWSSRYEQVGAAFTTLKSLAADDTPFTCCTDCWADQVEEIVDAVSQHLPHTRTLQMEVQTILPLHHVLPCFARCLPRLTGLAFLSFLNISSDHSTIFGDKAQSGQTRALVDVCPTLEACRFSEFPKRRRYSFHAD